MPYTVRRPVTDGSRSPTPTLGTREEGGGARLRENGGSPRRFGNAQLAHRITGSRGCHRLVCGTDFRDGGPHGRGTRSRPAGRLHPDRDAVRALGRLRPGRRGERPAVGRGRARARRRARRGAGQQARGTGRRRRAHAGQGWPDRPPVRRQAGGRGVQRLALVRRARRHPGPALCGGTQEPPAREAQGHRPHRPGSGDLGGQADPRRPRPAGRQPAGRALQLDPARSRVDLDRGQPPPDEQLHRQVAGQRQGGQEAAEVHRAVVRAGGQPRRLPVHVRPRAAVAQEPPRQQRGRPDPGRRRRRPQPQLPQPLGVRRGGLVVHPVQRDLPGPGADVRAGDPRPWSASSIGSGSPSR